MQCSWNRAPHIIDSNTDYFYSRSIASQLGRHFLVDCGDFEAGFRDSPFQKFQEFDHSVRIRCINLKCIEGDPHPSRPHTSIAVEFERDDLIVFDTRALEQIADVTEAD